MAENHGSDTTRQYTSRVRPRRYAAIALIGLLVAMPAWGAPRLDLSVTPRFVVPVALTLVGREDLFTVGAGVRLGAAYTLSRVPWLTFGADLEYDVIGTRRTDDTMSLIGASASAAFGVFTSDRIEVKPTVFGGFTQAIWGDMTEARPTLGAGLHAVLRLGPRLALIAGTGYANTIGLFEGVRSFIGTTYRFGRSGTEAFRPMDIRLEPVFPILYQQYDRVPFGNLALRNESQETVSDVRVSFFVGTYMDSPSEIARWDRVQQGEELNVDVSAMFNNRILSVTEGERVTADITIDYTTFDRTVRQTLSHPLHIHNRNALTWDDDRKAAAFVTARDPSILRFARNTVSTAERSPLSAINTNFRIAMAMFEAFHVYGIAYVVDPTSPYQELSRDAMALDFIQFPAQTLEYRAGDCDDLAILYNALLEAVGIETAFITTPGHIYSAVNLDMWPAEAERIFGGLDDLIVYDETVWLPVEITALRQGFLGAWNTGVRQWRVATDDATAAIYPTRHAWAHYPPVASPGDGAAVSSIPDPDRVYSVFHDRLRTFITRSIHLREQDLLARIRTDADVRPINALAVLYARHGLFDLAKNQLVRIQDRSATARVNLGNIAFINDEFAEAARLFAEALEKEPENDSALLGVAMSQHEMNNHGSAFAAYAELAQRNPELAARYDWVAGGAGGTVRASSVDRSDWMVWDE